MFEYIDSINSEKKNLKVVIFGPYKEGGFKRLEQLKEHLISRGYTQSNLVEALSDPPGSSRLSEHEFELAKSEYWITLADVSLYVFYKDLRRGSVSIEIKELADHAIHRVPCTSFFIESGEPWESLEWGLLDRMKKDYARFDTDDDLFALAEKACLHHLVEDDCIQNI
ncbi:MAG: hypothetical protein IIC67_01290 [Thaumarchaeota archaeon]|nr:hypothetical protein [Nitrososphaerota archaeon]